MDPAFYEVAGTGCDGRQAQRCLGTGLAITAENEDEDEGRCVIPVRQTVAAEGEPVSFDDDRIVELRVTGTIVCPPDRGQECAEFAEALEDENDVIQLDLPFVPTDGPGDTTTTSATAPAEDGSSP